MQAEVNVLNGRKKDFATKLNEVAYDFMDFIMQEFPEQVIYFQEKINDNVIALLDVEKPKVMVHGIYNSGKSTLINALCRAEVAEMADRPMTDCISEYDKGDYLLIDSPGVDAPIEHERVTEEYLNKCHIILFVISTKGVFEDRDNYRRLANLIARDIPFIIVLNERGAAIKKEWTDEQKERAKFDHQQDLKLIQYKVIKNLIKESNDPKIAEKYEVVILNAKKALTGMLKDKPRLYDASNVGFLDKRITQLIQNNDSVKAIFKQPMTNIRECISEIEKMITSEMNGDTSEDFTMRIHTLERKRDNIMEDLRVLTRQAVFSRLDELTNSYIQGDAESFETIANTIFMDIDERYNARVNELYVFVDRNFKNIDISMDTMSNLFFQSTGKGARDLSFGHEDTDDYTDADFSVPEEKKSWFWELFKSRRKKEEEQFQRLEREAELRNQREQYRLQEQIRKKQEARQYANSDLDELLRAFNAMVTKGLNDKFDGLLESIQQVDCENKQKLEDGKRQMRILKSLRDRVIAMENALS